MICPDCVRAASFQRRPGSHPDASAVSEDQQRFTKLPKVHQSAWTSFRPGRSPVDTIRPVTTLYVSFRGEYPTEADEGTKPAPIIRPIENIVAFPEGQASSEILQPPSDPSIELRELRGFLFLDGYLYVANGYKYQHQVLRFTPAQQQGQWQYDATVAAASLGSCSMIPGFDGALFVSSQDDNKVTVYGAAEPAGAVFLSGFTALRGLAYDGTIGTWPFRRHGKPGYVGIYDQTAGSHGQLPIAQPVHLLYDRLWLSPAET